MEGRERQDNGEERCDVVSPTEHLATTDDISMAPTWTNGQFVDVVSTSPLFFPRFDLTDCRALLDTKGFQVPFEDFEGPLHRALDHPSVRRYLMFNSSCFNCFVAAFLYLVLWLALFSTVHLYLKEDTANLWVLSLSVSVASIILTSTIILFFHYNNKEMNMNTDARLVAVNERLVRHRLMLGVSDWVQKCKGKLQLSCVYWDLSPCLRSLTEALEDMSFSRDQVQNRLKKKMSHLVLVTEVKTLEPEGGLQDEEVSQEERPLLEQRSEQGASNNQRNDSKLTKIFCLMPDTSLSHQAIAHQLLMAHSALYVRLLVSNKLPTSSQLPLGAGKNHSTSSLCLCEYVALKVLQ